MICHLNSAWPEPTENNFNLKRSGDIFVVFEPQRFINDLDGLTVASVHGSPWSYDTFVPIFVVGAGIGPRKVHRRVAPNDIAPTLSAIVGAKPPSGSVGELLIEVFEGPTGAGLCYAPEDRTQKEGSTFR